MSIQQVMRIHREPSPHRFSATRTRAFDLTIKTPRSGVMNSMGRMRNFGLKSESEPDPGSDPAGDGLTPIGALTFVLASYAGLLLANEMWSDKDPPAFVYPPLDDSSDSIRVLTLLPGTWKSFIICDLTATTFAENPEYEALSYAWGDSRKTKKIKVNGCWVQVNESIYIALRHLRYTDTPRTLWIDSLCIDQKDTREKNKQIPLMGFIYRRAQRVLIWLGNHKPPYNVHLALRRCQDWHDISTPGTKSKEWKRIEPFIWQLAHEEYWKRTWIIQEIIMASKLVVCYETKELRWTDFITWINRYQTLNPQDRSVDLLLALSAMRQFRYTDTNQFSLKHLIEVFGDSFSSIPHDKIYAFLGMTYDHLESSIPVDYDKSLYDVYRDVVQYFSVAFSNESKTQPIEMMFYSAFIRRLLTREGLQRPKAEGMGREGCDDKDTKALPSNSSASKQNRPKDVTHRLENSTDDRNQKKNCELHTSSFDRLGPAHTRGSGEAIYMPHIHKVMDAIAEDANADVKNDEKEEKLNKDRNLLGVIGGYVVLLAAASTGYHYFTQEKPAKPQEWYWQESGPEDLSTWIMQGDDDSEANERVDIRGSIAGRVMHIGPTVQSLAASNDKTKRWTSELSLRFSTPLELNKARGLNEKLLRLLHDTKDFRTRNIKPLQPQQDEITQSNSYMASSPHLFIGSNNLMGLVPPNAKQGDIIVQFWNSSACVVLREKRTENKGLLSRSESLQYEIVGRAAIVGPKGVDAEWEIPTDKERFAERARDGVDLSVTMNELTKLSLDTVNFSRSHL